MPKTLRWREGEKPLTFQTGSCAEHHTLSLHHLLHRWVRGTMGEDAAHAFATDDGARARMTVDLSHVVSWWFDVRTVMFVERVLKAALDVDDWFVRYEFAKSRGAIHWHGLMWSEALSGIVNDILSNGAEQVEEATKVAENFGKKEKAAHVEAARLAVAAEVGKFAEEKLTLSAMHPKTDATGWPAPEGTLPDPVGESACASHFYSTLEPWEMLAKICNQAMLHTCSSYCLKDKWKESGKPPVRKRHKSVCRMKFGEIKDFSGKKSVAATMSGKPLADVHSFTDDSRRTLEMKRNHPRIVQHSRFAVTAWRANCDVQVRAASRRASPRAAPAAARPGDARPGDARATTSNPAPSSLPSCSSTTTSRP